MEDLLVTSARSAAAFRAGLAERTVAPAVDLDVLRKALGGRLGATGPRFFGFAILRVV